MSADLEKRLSGFWDADPEYYEKARSANVELSAERRELFAHLAGGERVLDLGAGSCENALWLPAGCRYVGLDVSTGALGDARRLRRPGARATGTGARLPFADHVFDAVLSTWAIEHFADPPGTLLEAARVLRPGGLLLIVGSSWDLPWEHPPSVDRRRHWAVSLTRLRRQLAAWLRRRHLFEVVREPLVFRDGYVEPDYDAVHVTQSWLLGRFLEAAGLEIEELRSLSHAARDPGSPPGLARRAWRGAVGRVPPWRHGWGNLFLVARRGPELIHPPVELRYL